MNESDNNEQLAQRLIDQAGEWMEGGMSAEQYTSRINKLEVLVKIAGLYTDRYPNDTGFRARYEALLVAYNLFKYPAYALIVETELLPAARQNWGSSQ